MKTDSVIQWETDKDLSTLVVTDAWLMHGGGIVFLTLGVAHDSFDESERFIKPVVRVAFTNERLVELLQSAVDAISGNDKLQSS